MQSVVLVLVLSLACAGTRGLHATRVWGGGSELIPVVSVEGASPTYEIVMTTRHRGVEVPQVRQDLNAYGRMNLTVSIKNRGRSQEKVEVKARFFDDAGRVLDSADWTQVFVGPGETARVELLCNEEGAHTFKVLVR